MVDRIPSRSGGEDRADWIGFGPFAFDRRGELLRRDGVEVHLAPRAAAVLRELVEHPGEMVSKDDLLEAVWNGTPVTEDALTQAVSLIRQALEESDGVVAHAAKRLQMRRTTLVEKLRKYGLQRSNDAT